jgi:hypothetical protein
MWHAGDVVRELQVLKISVSEPGGWSLKLQKTEVSFSHWKTPLFVGQAECSDRANCSDRPAFARVERTINAFDANELALRTMGIKPPDPTNRLCPGERVMAMLDRTGSFLASQEKQLVAD